MKSITTAQCCLNIDFCSPNLSGTAFALASLGDFSPEFLLGCLVVLGCLLIYAAFNALVCFGGVIKACDDYLNKRKDGNNDSEPKNPFCEPTKYDCLTHEFFGLIRQAFSLFSRFRSKPILCIRNSKKFLRKLFLRVRYFNKFFNFPREPVNLFRQSNLCLKGGLDALRRLGFRPLNGLVGLKDSLHPFSKFFNRVHKRN